jgi:hypothetical protein
MKTYYIYDDRTLARSWELDYGQGTVIQYWSPSRGWYNAHPGSHTALSILQGTHTDMLKIVDEFEVQKWQFVRKI